MKGGTTHSTYLGKASFISSLQVLGHRKKYSKILVVTDATCLQIPVNAKLSTSLDTVTKYPMSIG